MLTYLVKNIGRAAGSIFAILFLYTVWNYGDSHKLFLDEYVNSISKTQFPSRWYLLDLHRLTQVTFDYKDDRL